MQYGGEREFSCPHCGQSIVINRSMQVAILGEGCPVCGARTSPDDFTA